jgi:hypothetical protein
MVAAYSPAEPAIYFVLNTPQVFSDIVAPGARAFMMKLLAI